MKILAYGFPLAGNFGGPSVVQGLREVVRRMWPSADFVFYNRGEPDGNCIEGADFSVLRDPYFCHPFKLLRDYVATQWFGIIPRSYCKKMFWLDFREADVIANVYAICFHHKRQDRVRRWPFLAALCRTFNFFGISVLARMTGKRSVKTTSSFGPMATKYELWQARLASRLCYHAFLAREEESARELMAASGLTNVPVAPDVGMFLPTEGRANVQPGRIGLAVSFQMIRQWNGREEGYVECMVGLVRHVLALPDTTVVLIPNQLTRSEGPNDEAVAQDIVAGLDVESRLRVSVMRMPGPRTLKGEIASCDVVVSSRYHTCVAGLSTGVPQFVIGWHRKYDEIMSLYGLREWVMRSEDCSVVELQKRFDVFWRMRAELRNGINVRRPAVEACALNGIHRLFNGEES